MTEKDLDRIAASLSKNAGVETVRKRIVRTVSYLKSDRKSMDMLFELARLLRDIDDLRRLLGTDNEMFQELAGPASKRGIELSSALIGKVAKDKELFIAMSDIAMAFANRGRKREKPKHRIKHKEGAK